MKKLILLVLFIVVLASCGVQKTHVRDYGKRIELVKTNFPEIYELFCHGSVVIDDVYTYEKDGKERVNIKYHYR